MLPQAESEQFLVETNQSDSIPTFHTVKYMLSIECKNLLFNAHPLAKKIWTTEEYIEYLSGKKIIDLNRTDVTFDTTSKKALQCK